MDLFYERRPEDMSLAGLLPRVGSALTRHFQRVATEYGLTPTSMGALRVLGVRNGLSHRELASHLGLTPGTLTSVIDGLELRGEVRRERDRDDRRIVRLFITTAGSERTATALAEVAVSMRETLPQPPAEHAEIIRSYLLAVLAAVTRDEG